MEDRALMLSEGVSDLLQFKISDVLGESIFESKILNQEKMWKSFRSILNWLRNNDGREEKVKPGSLISGDFGEIAALLLHGLESSLTLLATWLEAKTLVLN